MTAELGIESLPVREQSVFVSEQGELNLAGSGPTTGLDRWREERRQAQRELARRLGLPLGHPVEVWLTNGIRLRGDLQLTEQLLFVEENSFRTLKLMVDGVEFTQNEIESCVRQD